MDLNDEIIELDPDFDLENISPNDVLDSLGISDASMECLLEMLKKGAEEVKAAFKNLQGNKIQEYHAIGRRYAPVAFAIYSRLFDKGEEPRIRTYLAANLAKARKCYPDSITFWDDVDAIVGLYESLEKDGYYASTSGS